MKERDKTKEQRVAERRVAELQMSQTQYKRKERRTQEALKYAEDIIETVRESLLVLDSGLRVIRANRSFYNSFKVTPEETIGNFIYDLGNGQWDIPRLRALLEDILPKDNEFNDYEVEHEFSNAGHKIMLLNARRIYRKDINAQMILLAIEDITGHKRPENLLTQPEERRVQVFETAGDKTVLLEKSEGSMANCVPDVEELPGTEHERTWEELLESGDWYRVLYFDSVDPIMILSPDRGFLAGNPAAIKLFACRDEKDFTARSPALLSPEYQPGGVRSEEKALEMIRMALEKGSHFFEWTHRRADGTDFPATVLLSQIESMGTRFLQATVRDISAQKLADKILQQNLDSLRKAFDTTIQVMVSAVEVRDPYTAGHQLRSTNLACAIADEMGLAREKIDGIRMAGSIHDIGKLYIPAEVLSKPARLTESEFSLVKEHSSCGYEILRGIASPWPLAQIVYQHHERINGTGYPKKLKGDDILLEARIMAVADVVEAMASHRSYRPALGIEAALEEIEKNKGILYDEKAVGVCLGLFREKGFKFEGN